MTLPIPTLEDLDAIEQQLAFVFASGDPWAVQGWAKDFPEGTVLKVSAEVLPPDTGQEPGGEG